MKMLATRAEAKVNPKPENLRCFLRINNRKKTWSPSDVVGAKYPVVVFNWRDFGDIVRYLELCDQMDAWCDENIGRGKWLRLTGETVAFVSEKDAIAFKLRFG
jgi:hypothetical protein